MKTPLIPPTEFCRIQKRPEDILAAFTAIFSRLDMFQAGGSLLVRGQSAQTPQIKRCDDQCIIFLLGKQSGQHGSPSITAQKLVDLPTVHHQQCLWNRGIDFVTRQAGVVEEGLLKNLPCFFSLLLVSLPLCAAIDF